MEPENKHGRKTKIRQECEDGELNGLPGSVGTLSSPRSETWNDSFRIGRANRDESNPLTISTGKRSTGGIGRQLIEETRKQLAYHKTQVSELETRLKELEQLTDDLDQQETQEQQEDSE
jgi:hypothetical protein